MGFSVCNAENQQLRSPVTHKICNKGFQVRGKSGRKKFVLFADKILLAFLIMMKYKTSLG